MNFEAIWGGVLQNKFFISLPNVKNQAFCRGVLLSKEKSKFKLGIAFFELCGIIKIKVGDIN